MIKFYCLLIGYFFGCFQTAYIVGRLNNINIKEFGSKNAGATNITRALGKSLGIIVACIDILKTILAYYFCIFLFKDKIFGIYSALGVILGHDFTFYLKFNGGKGVASTAGLLLMLDWRIGLIIILTWLISVLLIRQVFIGAIISALFLPILSIIYKLNLELSLMLLIISSIAIIKHFSNIKEFYLKIYKKINK